MNSQHQRQTQSTQVLMGTIQIQTKQKNESSDNKKKLVVGPVVGPYLSKTHDSKHIHVVFI